MKFRDNPVETFDGFEIDIAAIDTTTSTKQDRISLIYTGPLPAQIGDMELATVSINIPVSLDIHATLVVKVRGNVNPQRYLLEASPEELNAILTAILYHDHTRPDGGGYLSPRKDNGLSPYWNGLLQARLIARQMILQRPGEMADDLILSILTGVPEYRLQEILERQHPNATEE